MTADPTTPEEKLTDELLQLTERELDNAQRAADAYAEEPRIGASWFIVKRLIAEVRRSRTLQQQGMGWEERAESIVSQFRACDPSIIYDHAPADKLRDLIAQSLAAIHQEATERAAKNLEACRRKDPSGKHTGWNITALNRLVGLIGESQPDALAAIRATGEKA